VLLFFLFEIETNVGIDGCSHCCSHCSRHIGRLVFKGMCLFSFLLLCFLKRISVVSS
jgi:hypothetical protein